jgi:hypothetical protein
LGVTRILYIVSLVLAVRVVVDKVISELVPVGLATEPYTAVPSLETISIKLVEDALLCETVRSVMTSVPSSVWKVNALVTVAVLPGAIVNGNGSVVEAEVRVVVTEASRFTV